MHSLRGFHGPVISLHLAGFTLLELLTALVVAAILLSIAIPSFSAFHLREALQTDAQLVFRLAQSSRESSQNFSSNIVLCGTHDFHNCELKEFRGLMAFIDENNSKIREDNEPLLHQLRISDRLVMHSVLPPGKREKLFKFRAEGHANPYGSFYLCSADKRASKMGQRVAISNVGRNRLGASSPTEFDECAARL